MPDRILEPQQALHLRLEGLALAGLGLALFTGSGQSWWLFAALILVPDLAMLGYLGGPRIGAHVYNTGHNLTVPALIVGLGWVAAAPVAIAIGAIWWTHIGIDRALGFGMKSTEGFKRTHLSFQ